MAGPDSDANRFDLLAVDPVPLSRLLFRHLLLRSGSGFDVAPNLKAEPLVLGITGGFIFASSKRNAEVKSPNVFRRHSEMFGSRTPVNFSSNCSTDVWSNDSLATHPPAVHGDTIIQGTRNPPPIGSPSTNSPSVTLAANGGGTRSKRPSFSS